MPKLRQLDPERLTADYASREHTLDELCGIYQCSKRVLVRNLRELGLSGTGVRKKGVVPAPPDPKILEDYEAGELHMREIATKYGVSNRDVYRLVREAKAKPRLMVNTICQACGERFRPTHKTSAHEFRHLCSGECLMWARMHPEAGISVEGRQNKFRDPVARYRTKKEAEERGRILMQHVHMTVPKDLEAWDRAFDTFGHTEIPWIPQWQGGEDRRGKSRRVEGGTYFGAFADRPVLLRFSQAIDVEVYFSICRRPDETSAECVARKYLGGQRDYAELFDAVIAWQCGCPSVTRVVIETLDDLPDEPGDYGMCPQCHVVALEVLCEE